MELWKDIKRGGTSKSLWASVSAAALVMGTVLPAHAQDVPAEDDEIVATGIRQSLKSSQDLKANADTFIDAITAEDIGALPDRSVSEALQRVPGVSIIRFSGANDPDHFDVEGSGVVVRGLPFVRSELNGRDVFAANDSGVLGFEDVSPELLGSVVVFKNQSADLIEGGIAGSIDLRTRLPFDGGGKRVIAGTIEGTYSDLSEEIDPSGSVLLSDTWDTKAGRFGLLLNGSLNNLTSRADSVQIASFARADFGEPFIPGGGGFRTQDFDRERRAFAAAAQWENPDETLLATAQFLRSDASVQWGENAFESGVDGQGVDQNTGFGGRNSEFDRADFVFDEDGVFQSGTITDNGVWRGPNATAALFPANGGQHQNIMRQHLTENITNDFGFNLKYAPKDNLRFNFDAQYIDSTSEVTDLQFGASFLSSIAIDISDDSDPTVDFVQASADGNTQTDLGDLSSFFIRNFLDHRTENDAESIAFRGDVEYDFSDDGWLKSVRSGVRYSDQDTTLRESDFNWGNVSELWTGRDISGLSNGFNDNVSVLLLGGNSSSALNSIVDPLFETRTVENFNRTGNDLIIPTYVGPGVNDFQGYQDTVNAILAATQGPDVGGPTSTRPCGTPNAPLTSRVCTNGDSLVPGTPFLESEIGGVDRQTFAAYTRFDFGWDGILGGDGISLTGNAGLRYVNTDRTATSIQVAPSFDTLFNPIQRARCDDATRLAESNADGNGIDTPGFCNLDLAALQAAFGNGAVQVTPVDVSYDEWLPSLNLKLDLDNGHLLRFAASRTLSRPSVSELSQRPAINTFSDIETGIDNGTGGTVQAFGGFQGSQSGNAQLTPQLATSFDVSWEWYFNDSGSITLTAFHKEIDDFINPAPLSVLAPDGTPLQISGQNVPFNSFINEQNETAVVKGAEFAYQQFYDFLPGVLSGLGAQFNYSYIDADGIEPTIDPDLPSDDPVVGRFAVDRGVFPRVSEHNINLVGLYEKGPVQARLAYNWRSEFQVTPRDVIFPFASIYQPATGQLDASMFFDVNENIKIGVQGVNLLDDVTETTQSISDAGLRAPRSFFRNDRRFSLIARATF
jgi:TonB-dependent receptor